MQRVKRTIKPRTPPKIQLNTLTRIHENDLYQNIATYKRVHEQFTLMLRTANEQIKHIPRSIQLCIYFPEVLRRKS